MNTTHPLVWFGHNLVTTLYERSFTSKFCSFRVLSQEFGGKSKKMAVTWGLDVWFHPVIIPEKANLAQDILVF